MCHIEGEKMEELEFKWGKESGTRKIKEDVHFYESFTYDGEEYSLYDSVFMLGEWEGVPYVGKLVKIWEEADKSRKIKVQWFFRPSEISHYLRDVEVLENELIFGSGCGIGLANINPLEAIAGKCNVVCISTDNRNPQPSAEEVTMANYVFHRIFDVQSHVVSDQMPSIIGGLQVEFVFNIKESDKAFNIPKFDSKRKYNARNTITCNETWRLACKNSPERLESLNASENCNRLVEEEDTSEPQVQTKKKSLLGETKLNSGSTRKRKCSSVDVNSSKDAEHANTIENRSTLDANVGYKVNSEEDQVKDVKSLANQVNIEERVTLARNSCNLGDVSLIKTSSNDKCTHDVHGFTIPGSGNDVMPLMIGTTSCDANSKSKHTADVVGLEKVSKLAKDLNALEKKVSGTNVIVYGEKAKSRHAQNFVSPQKDLKTSKSFSTCRKLPSMSNEVLANKTLKFGGKGEFGEIGQLIRFVEDSSAFGKRLTKTRAYPSSGKPNNGQDFRCERDNTTLAYLSSPKEEGSSKKAKLDDSKEEGSSKKAKLDDSKEEGSSKKAKLDDSVNNVIQKLKEKSCASKMKNYSIANKTSKFGSKEEFGEIGRPTKFVEDSSAFRKRPTKTRAYPSSGKPNYGQDFRCERENTTLAYLSSPKEEEGPSKKAKLDDSVNNVIQKLKEKSCASKMKNYSPFIVSLNDNESKSRFPKQLGKLGGDRSKEHWNDEIDELLGGNLSKLSVPTSKGDDREVEGRIFEATRRPIIEKSKWFKELSWEESVKTASDEGKFVLLQNFDPDFTSGEVEDIIWHAFNEYCRVRMLQHTAISNPHYGQAIVILRTSEVAERVVKKLDDGCLMLPNQRPLVGCTVVLPKLPGKQMTFVGHLCMDKVRRQPKRERKEAVSSSHFSQTNTIEYEMAMEWCLLQSKSDAWWQNLFELQKEKLKKLMANLKSKCTSTAI